MCLYDLDKISLNILFNYLNNRKQRLVFLLALGTALLQEYNED